MCITLYNTTNPELGGFIYLAKKLRRREGDQLLIGQIISWNRTFWFEDQKYCPAATASASARALQAPSPASLCVLDVFLASNSSHICDSFPNDCP